MLPNQIFREVKPEDWKDFLGEDCLRKEISVKSALQRRFGVADIYVQRVVAKLRQLEDFKEFYDVKEQLRMSKRETTLKNYGVTNPTLSPIVRERVKETHRRKFGGKINTALTEEQIIERLKINGIIPLEEVPNCKTGVTYRAKCSSCGRIFDFHFHNARPTHCPMCGKRSTVLERKIFLILESKGLSPVQHYTAIFGGSSRREIDIYIPEKKLGFEINGAYTHNSGMSPFEFSAPKDKNFHRDKSEEARLNGIKLYHIWEDWGEAKAINSVLAALSIFETKYQARKLSLNRLDGNPGSVVKFFKKNHNYGFRTASITYTLSLDDTIIQAVSFIIRGSTAEIIRTATLNGSVVIGGFSRILKNAEEYLKSKGVSTIITNAYRDLTPFPEDSVYSRHGFTFIKDTGPMLQFYANASFWRGDSLVLTKGLYSREHFQKHKLVSLNGITLKRNGDNPFIFNANLTALQNLEKLKVYPVYNSGNYYYEKKI